MAHAEEGVLTGGLFPPGFDNFADIKVTIGLPSANFCASEMCRCLNSLPSRTLWMKCETVNSTNRKTAAFNRNRGVIASGPTLKKEYSSR